MLLLTIKTIWSGNSIICIENKIPFIVGTLISGIVVIGLFLIVNVKKKKNWLIFADTSYNYLEKTLLIIYYMFLIDEYCF